MIDNSISSKWNLNFCELRIIGYKIIIGRYLVKVNVGLGCLEEVDPPTLAQVFRSAPITEPVDAVAALPA